MSKKPDKKLQVKTWQIAFVLAAVVLIMFLLLHADCFTSMIRREIPDPHYRTLCVGMILAVVVFIVCGMFHHYLCPVKEKTRTEIGASPLGIMNR